MSDQTLDVAQRAFHAGDLDRTAQICESILAHDIDNAPATLLAGLTASRTGRLEAAIELLRRALELSPNDYVGLSWLQGTLRAAGRKEEAIKTGEKARGLWPDDVDVLVSLSVSYLAVQDIARAAHCLESASAADPSNSAVHRK